MSQLDRRIRGSLLGGCFALAALVTLAWAPHDDDAELLPEQILLRMHDVYAACDSYSDTGKVRTVFHSERGERVDVKPFATAFRRPDRFRFEYLDAQEWLGDTTWSHYVVWQGGDEVRTHWDVTPHADPPPSLRHALVAATGVSSRSSLTVPQMLLPDLITSNSFLGLALLQRLPDAAIGDVDCFRVRGSSQRSPTTLWISKDALLLRRIETERHFDTFRTVTTTDYDPVLNVELSDAELAFDASPFPR